MDAIARRKVAAGLGDADDGPAGLQLLASQAVGAESLDVDGRLAGLRRVVKPDSRCAGVWEFSDRIRSC